MQQHKKALLWAFLKKINCFGCAATKKQHIQLGESGQKRMVGFW